MCRPGAKQLDPSCVAQDHAVDYAVEAHKRPPQAVTKDGCPAVEAYHAVKMRTKWTDTGTEMVALTYNDADTMGIIEAREQQARAGRLQKCDGKFHPTTTTAIRRGPGSQSLRPDTSKCGIAGPAAPPNRGFSTTILDR